MPAGSPITPDPVPRQGWLEPPEQKQRGWRSVALSCLYLFSWEQNHVCYVSYGRDAAVVE